MEESFAISVRNLGKRYRLGGREDAYARGGWNFLRAARALWTASQRGPGGHDFWALKDVSFTLNRGERLGIIGRNGAGKSTLLKIISRLIYPTEGEVRIRGRVTALLEVGTGMNENLTGRENIFVNAALHGMTRETTRRMLDEIVEFSGLGEFIDEPVKAYSSGMRSRLGFAVAAHLDPDILILDEVLAVGDMAFVQKCMRKVEGLTSSGRTVIFVSHSMGDIVRFCDRALWLEKGGMVMTGPVQEVIEAYSKSMLALTSEAAIPQPAAGPDLAPVAARADAVPDPERPAAEIVAFKLLDSEHRTKAVFLRDEPMYVAVRYKALRDDLPLIVNVHVHMEGVHVFSSHPASTTMPVRGSMYEAVMTIPARILNKGLYQFSAAVVTPVRPILRHARIDMGLSASVFHRITDGDIFSGDYRGVVRPELPWSVDTCE